MNASNEQNLFNELNSDEMDSVSDLPLRKKPVKNLEEELFGKKGVKEVIDEFEKAQGFTGNKPTAPTKLKYYNKVFNVNRDDDRTLLNTLLNDTASGRFSIIMWEKNWTVHGDFKLFVIYSENLDFKKPEEDEDNE